MKQLIVIAGPTAIGKSALALRLAQELNTSIISADSRQCYIEMNIGTAKPTAEELDSVKHYFINSHSITDDLNAGDFERLGMEYLNEIFQTSDHAILCGGTGLYIAALCEGLDVMPKVSKKTEEEVNDLYISEGRTALQEALKQEDPLFAENGEMENPARMIRALSFKRSTGKSIFQYQKKQPKQRDFNIVKIGLELPREQLYGRINHRVDEMMNAGLLQEVKGLYRSRRLKALNTVGYAELFDHLEGVDSLVVAVERIKQHTRNYAKRQMTWFRKDEQIKWMNAEQVTIQDILSVV